MNEISIRTEFIKLQQALKLSGIIGQGSDVKILLGEGLIWVNGVQATERGKKIRVGDHIEVKDMGEFSVIAAIEE